MLNSACEDCESSRASAQNVWTTLLQTKSAGGRKVLSAVLGAVTLESVDGQLTSVATTWTGVLGGRGTRGGVERGDTCT